MSIGGEHRHAASIQLLKDVNSPRVPSRSTVTEQDLSSFRQQVVAARLERYLPEENPEVAINEESSLYLAALLRMNLTPAFKSCRCAG